MQFPFDGKLHASPLQNAAVRTTSVSQTGPEYSTHPVIASLKLTVRNIRWLRYGTGPSTDRMPEGSRARSDSSAAPISAPISLSTHSTATPPPYIRRSDRRWHAGLLTLLFSGQIRGSHAIRDCAIAIAFPRRSTCHRPHGMRTVQPARIHAVRISMHANHVRSIRKLSMYQQWQQPCSLDDDTVNILVGGIQTFSTPMPSRCSMRVSPVRITRFGPGKL